MKYERICMAEKARFRLDQVQNYIRRRWLTRPPMYYTGKNPLARLVIGKVFVPKGDKQHRLPRCCVTTIKLTLIRQALEAMNKTSIGSRRDCLVPA